MNNSYAGIDVVGSHNDTLQRDNISYEAGPGAG